MRALLAWGKKLQDTEKSEQWCIYSLCFNPSGTQLIVASGQTVLVYNTSDGELIQRLKGHKDTVYCVCYAKDGRRFASGGADRTVIIWTSKLEAVLKYTHSDAVQCMAYNPVTHSLVSCGLTEFIFSVAEPKSLQKNKSGARINCCAWTNDGQYLALGLSTGCVSIRSKNGEEKGRIERPGGSLAAIWALAWSPPRVEDSYDILCVTDWQQTLSFYTLGGKQVSKERNLGFDPLCVSYLSKGQYILVCGSNRGVLLLTRDGMCLGNVGDVQDSWVWCCAGGPDATFVAMGCQDGSVACYQLVFSTVHSLYRERYTYRENMTDVIIHHLLTNQKVRIKCRDLIKKIAIYKHRLAVQLPERIVIYELNTNDPSGMLYKVKDKINSRFDCNLLVVCTNHVVMCQERKLHSLTFEGVREREWIMDSPIRYIRLVGGPAGREGLLLGLLNGQVWKIYLDNAFPVSVLQMDAGVRCLDLSASKRKLAVVDDNSVCSVFDVTSKELLFKEPDASSVAWNSHCEDMLCFSGNDILSIKASNFPVHQQKLQGFVVGVIGSKIFCLQVATCYTVEVPLSAPMYQYLEHRQFTAAYQVACLGVTEGDWRALAMAALEGLDLDIARKAFTRVGDLPYLQLIGDMQDRQRKADKDRDLLLADLWAFRGRFKEAAKLYQRAGQEQRALNMYTDLRMFDFAQEFLGSGDTVDRKALIRKKADWARNINEPRAAAEMYLSAGDTQRAIEIIADNGWIDMLIELGGRLDQSDRAGVSLIAERLRQLGQVSAAADILSRLGEERAVLQLLVEAGQWRDAFAMASRLPELSALVYVPYAQWLAENDRFVDAQKAFHKAGKPEEAFNVLQQLTLNAVNEGRFNDAGYYYWVLARQSLDLARQRPQSSKQMIEKFEDHSRLASIYYAYHTIQCYVDEPFTSYMAEALFNIALFVYLEVRDKQPPKGVSLFAVLYALSKQARTLGAYKLARQVLDKIQTLRIPARLQDYVSIAALTIRSQPYHDNEELQPMCYRCSTYNPLLAGRQGNRCSNCGQPFVHSFASFEVLPIVEFELEEGLTDEEAVRLIEAPVTFGEGNHTQWATSQGEDYQALQLQEEIIPDPFTRALRLTNFENATDDLVPVVVTRAVLAAMESSSVLISKWPSPLRWRYYRNILPDLQVTQCGVCFKMFHVDDFELQTLQIGHCPFCRCHPGSTAADAFNAADSDDFPMPS